MIFAIVLLVLLGISALFNLGYFVGKIARFEGIKTVNTRPAGPRLDETVLEDNNAPVKFAVVDIDGIISSESIDQSGFSMVDILKAQLDQAQDDHKVKAVILKVDSPGGEVLASDEIYRAIAEFQEDSHKPVIASMGSLAASGGYYVSSPCRWIVANELTITGSIGVILHTWNYRSLMDKVGLRPEVYKSGKFKDMLSGERETTEIPPEERAMVQALIDETYAKFKSVVAEGRRHAHELNKKDDLDDKALATNWESYADGRVLSGTEAFKLGFVDELGNFDDAVDRAKDIVGVKDANLIRYQMRYDLSDLFRLFGKSQARSVKVDLGFEPPKLEAGHLYFLWPVYLY